MGRKRRMSRCALDWNEIEASSHCPLHRPGSTASRNADRPLFRSISFAIRDGHTPQNITVVRGVRPPEQLGSISLIFQAVDRAVDLRGGEENPGHLQSCRYGWRGFFDACFYRVGPDQPAAGLVQTEQSTKMTVLADTQVNPISKYRRR